MVFPVYTNCPELPLVLEADSPGTAMKSAIEHLYEVVESGTPSNPALVLDIDDTAILTSTNRFLRNEAVFALYSTAIYLSIPVFFVTARPKLMSMYDHETKAVVNALEITARDLVRAGYNQFSDLVMMPPLYLFSANQSEYKYLARLELERVRKCNIILNVGDQWTDLFLLPMNPNEDNTSCVIKALRTLDLTKTYFWKQPNKFQFSIKLPTVLRIPPPAPEPLIVNLGLQHSTDDAGENNSTPE